MHFQLSWISDKTHSNNFEVLSKPLKVFNLRSKMSASHDTYLKLDDCQSGLQISAKRHWMEHVAPFGRAVHPETSFLGMLVKTIGICSETLTCCSKCLITCEHAFCVCILTRNREGLQSYPVLH